jgi:glutathione S-transferase
MKLYTHPGAGSLSVHILLREIGAPFELEVVDVARKLREDGRDYRLVAPRGMVPLLELDDGSRLTENVVMAQYVCDEARREDLMPAAGTTARLRVAEWQSFIATELHKSFVPLNWPLDDATRALVLARITDRLAAAERDLVGPYATGDAFTAADAYLFVVVSWSRFFGISLIPFPRLTALVRLVGRRPSVHDAIRAEGQGRVSLPDPVPQS